MDIRSLLNQLSDGAFHSGSSLGKSLGVSRAAVWKALGRLSELNLNIETVKGKGYCLCGGLDLLERELILKHTALEIQKKINLDLMLSIESTNSFLMAKTVLDADFEICMSEMQLAGRGRRGKEWVSPFGKNIYLSVAFDLQGGVEVLNGLSLVIGLAVIRSLKALGVQEAVLKWPNDVWIDSKKVGGILVELQGEATTGWKVVAGLGLNVAMQQEDASEIDQPWISLGEKVSCTRSEIAGMLVTKLIYILEEFKLYGFEHFLSEWAECDFLKDKDISLNAGKTKGRAVGINAQGALLLETNRGLEVVNAGEVSVRPI